MSAPLVSALLLSQGSPERLQVSLEALSKQSYENLEIWVLDNGNSTSEEVAKVVSKEPKAKLVSLFGNRGYAGAMNVGLDVANGQYLFLTTDSVWILPDCVEKLARLATKIPGAGLFSGPLYDKTLKVLQFGGGNQVLGPRYQRIEIRNALGPAPFLSNVLTDSVLFMETGWMREHQGFRRDFFCCRVEDELAFRMQRFGRAVMLVPEAKAVIQEEKMKSRPIEFHLEKNLFALYMLFAPFSTLLQFVFRNLGFRRSGRCLSRWTSVRAQLWCLRNSPRLLLDRLQSRR